MEAGSIVISKAGRDKGKRFVVVAIENEYAFLADGDLRKADKPKKKKLKHIQPTHTVAEIGTVLKNGGSVENYQIRRAIEESTNA